MCQAAENALPQAHLLQATACNQDDVVLQYGSAFLLTGDLKEQKRHLEVSHA